MCGATALMGIWVQKFDDPKSLALKTSKDAASPPFSHETMVLSEKNRNNLLHVFWASRSRISLALSERGTPQRTSQNK